ncbi:ABC transporter permease subunit [Microbacterium sp.]|uniref:ABC transporter permease subunit n=1 Tax=Microbacterium sp. TaxID=51671 RepID=UPI003A83F8B0
MNTPVLRRWLADGWRALIGWAIGLAAVIGLYLPLYPSMRSPELQGLLDSLPPELVATLNYGDIATGAGYTSATFFGLVGFALLSIAAIGWGAALIGGAEETGRLELTLAHGVGRVGYALQAASVLVVKLLALGTVTWLLVWAVNGPSELDLDAGNLTAMVVSWLGLGLVTGSAALAAGAVTGRRVWGVGAGAAVAVAGYTLQAVANNAPVLDWLRSFSPYDWAFGASPLAGGWDLPGLALLYGGSVVLLALATLALSRRDVLG